MSSDAEIMAILAELKDIRNELDRLKGFDVPRPSGDFVRITGDTMTGSLGIGIVPIATLEVHAATDQNIGVVANGNGNDTGATSIISINDANNAYAPLALIASRFNFLSGHVGLNTDAPGMEAVAGRGYATLKGSSSIGVLQLTSAAADGDGVNQGNIEWRDSNSTNTSSRVAYIATFLSGSTAGKRGSALAFATKPDNDAGSGTERMRIDNAGIVSVNTKCAMNPDGGFMVKLTNKTGGNSVKGEVVMAYDAGAVNNAVAKIVQNEPDPIGVFYESGVADGAEAWIVVAGIADVYFIGNTTRGHLARGFVTADAGYVTGQALSEAVPGSPFATDKHWFEIGHLLESRVGAGLARCVLHFN